MLNKLPSEYLTEFLNFIANAQSHYKFCYDEVNNHDKLTQDYLHSLELDELKCKKYKSEIFRLECEILKNQTSIRQSWEHYKSHNN